MVCSHEMSTVSNVTVLSKSICSHRAVLTAFVSLLVAHLVPEFPSTALSAVKLVPDSTSLADAGLFSARLSEAAAAAGTGIHDRIMHMASMNPAARFCIFFMFPFSSFFCYFFRTSGPSSRGPEKI